MFPSVELPVVRRNAPSSRGDATGAKGPWRRSPGLAGSRRAQSGKRYYLYVSADLKNPTGDAPLVYRAVADRTEPAKGVGQPIPTRLYSIHYDFYSRSRLSVPIGAGVRESMRCMLPLSFLIARFRFPNRQHAR